MGADELSYTGVALQRFMVDYCRAGYSAGELGKRNSQLRTHARRQKLAFPPLGSDEWRQVTETRKSMLKKNPLETKKAVVLSMEWVARLAASFGVREHGDLATADAGHVYVLTRLLVAHNCMLRGCEHRIRWCDVSSREMGGAGCAPSPMTVKVNADCVTKAGRKLKLRPPRECTLVHSGGALSAGAALEVFEDTFGRGGADNGFVFGNIKHGVVNAKKYLHATTFMSRVRRLARAAGVSVEGSYVLSAQGLRLGGRTDWRVFGMSNDWIRHQGGWLGDSEKGYDQPLRHHRLVEARDMESAMASMSTAVSASADCDAIAADDDAIFAGGPWAFGRMAGGTRARARAAARAASRSAAVGAAVAQTCATCGRSWLCTRVPPETHDRCRRCHMRAVRARGLAARMR